MCIILIPVLLENKKPFTHATISTFMYANVLMQLCWDLLGFMVSWTDRPRVFKTANVKDLCTGYGGLLCYINQRFRIAKQTFICVSLSLLIQPSGCLIRYVHTHTWMQQEIGFCWNHPEIFYKKKHERGKTPQSESLWGARCIFSNCMRDLAVALGFVFVVLSRSAAPQKDRRSFAFLQCLVNMTLSPAEQKKRPLHVPSEWHVARTVRMEIARRELPL